MARWLLILVLGGATAGVAAACSTGAKGIAACKAIETARCKLAPSCTGGDSGINLSGLNTPPGDDPVEECIQYYNVDCLHGLAIDSDPTSTQVNQCVDAISIRLRDGGANCNVVQTPWSAAVCAWLQPADVDASEAAASDAGPVLCSGQGDGGADANLDPPSSWTYDFTPNPDGGAGTVCATVAGVNGGASTCVSCSLDPSTDSQQCEVSLGNPLGTSWTLALDPATSIVYITETGGLSWTPQCN